MTGYTDQLQEAENRAMVLMRDNDPKPFGTKVQLMHSGVSKVTATKRSEVGMTIRVQSTITRSYRIRRTTKWDTMINIIEMDQEIKNTI